MTPLNPSYPTSLCECGCGQYTATARKTNRSHGHVKGVPLRFINGHSGIAMRWMPKVSGDGLTPNQRYYRKNKETSATKVKQWLDQHPNANAAACKRYYEKTSEAQCAKAKRYYREVLKPQSGTDERRLFWRIKEANRRKCMNGKVTVQEWRSVLEQYRHKCFWCGTEGNLQMDHVVPITKGGKHEKANIVPACGPCNASRGNRYSTPPRIKRTA